MNDLDQLPDTGEQAALEVIQSRPLASRQSQEIATLPKTAQELRVMEVSEALLPAYQKASTLELTDAEIEALQKPFPDSTVEIRPHDGLIYIPHINISDRLNAVLKPGKWSLVCRRHWMEGGVMYGEYILLIRGCYVGESVGGHTYVANNPKTNFSDALESTAAEALRRIAGKRLSCGSQVWLPEYARQWVAKYAEKGRDGKWYRKQAASAPQSAPAAQSKPKPTESKPKPADAPQMPTEATRKWALSEVEKAGLMEYLPEWLEAAGIIMPGENLSEWPLMWVPASKEQMAAVIAKVKAFSQGEPAEKPFVAHGAEKFTAIEVPREAPSEEQIEIDPSWIIIEGEVATVSEKQGKSAKGPWTLWGIKIGAEWYNTFSNSIGHAAQAAKQDGREVKLYYVVNEERNQNEAQHIV